MPNTKNKETVEELTSRISNAKSIVFAHYHGLSAQDMNDLRAKLSEIKAEAIIAKNTLVKIALKENDHNDNEIDAEMKGPTVTVLSYDDPVSGVKTLFNFAKEHDNHPEIRAGVVDGKYIKYRELEILSTLPSKPELLSKVAGGLKSPMYGLVNTLGGVQKNFVYVLSAIADKKSE